MKYAHLKLSTAFKHVKSTIAIKLKKNTKPKYKMVQKTLKRCNLKFYEQYLLS